MSNNDPEILRQWRAEQRVKSRRAQWSRKLARGIWSCVVGIFAAGVVVGSILAIVIYSAPERVRFFL